MKKNPYDTLGVKTDATPEQIKKAYRKRAKSAHSDTGGSDEEMIELNNAYALLANPMRRKGLTRLAKPAKSGASRNKPPPNCKPWPCYSSPPANGRRATYLPK